MKRRTLKRLAAAFLTGAMMVATLGMSVCAEGTDSSVKTFTKKVTKEAKAYAPATKYVFNIAPANGLTENGFDDYFQKADGVAPAIYVGKIGGAQFITAESTYATSLEITSAPETNDIGKTELTYTGKIKVDISKFDNPGIYRYIITETDSKYAGITYDTYNRYLDVYIAYDTAGNLAVAGTVLSDGTTKDIFTNSYDTVDLTVSKTVTGNQGDKDKEFDFYITVTGATGEKYYIEVYKADGTEKNGSSITITSAAAEQNIKLANGESFKVFGLSKDDKYVVREEDYSADGYTTTNTKSETDGKTTGEVTIGETPIDETVTFTNNKEVTVTTGIITTFAPYVLMVAFAAVVAFFFLRRRNREI